MAPWTHTSHHIFHFGSFEVDLRTGEIRKNGTKLKVPNQPFKVLAMLLAQPGELVTREQLRKGLWSDDTFVGFESGLNTAVNRLRAVLNDSAETPRFVETVGRRGYRFVAPVTGKGSEETQDVTGSSTSCRRICDSVYQRELRDVLGLQNEIAIAVAKQVQATMRPLDRMAQRPVIPAAYEAYWKGEYLLDKVTPESLQKAAGYFQEAIEKDPEYVAAYTKLGATYRLRGAIGALPNKESYLKAALVTEKALEIDPLSDSAHAGRGWGALLYDLDLPTAHSEFKRAVELNPNGAQGHKGLAEYYAAVGELDEAVLEVARAREVDPLSFIVNNDVCKILYFARRFDQALAQCKANLDMDPEMRRSLWRMGSIYAAMGEEKEAASTFIQAFQNAGAKPATLTALTKGAQESGLHGMWEAALHLINQEAENQDPFGMATAYMYAGNKEKALTLLDRAYQQRCFGITWLAVDPTYDSLRSDRRFQILVSQMSIPQ